MSRRAWLISLVVVGLIFISTTGLILSRISTDQLWGHLALYQLSSGWSFLLLLIAKKALRNRAVFRNFLWGSASAVLLTLGFPPFPFPFLLFLGFVPLLLSLDRCAKASFRQKFLLIYHTFLLWNILSTYWVANTAYAAGIFANSVNALLMTIPIFAFLFVRKKLGSTVGLVIFASSWITFEFLHMHWDLYWPWLTLGNGLSTMHAGIQWFDHTGVFGGSLWILVANYLIYDMVVKGIKKQEHLRLALWLLIPVMISIIQYNTLVPANDHVEVVAVQPNFEPHYEKFQVTSEEVMERIINLAKPLITLESDYLVLPETSFSRIDMDRITTNPSLAGFHTLQSQFPNLKIVTGLGAYRILREEHEINLPTSRPLTQQDQIIYIEEYNCAVQLDVSGKVQEYYKSLYVPGAEFFPFQKILFFLQPIVDQLGGTNYGYRIRTRLATFESDPVIVAPAICYESIFGEFINKFIKRGAQTIFIMTNDGWWDKTGGHIQHAKYAKLRAIETRRSIARSANMGTTCFINTRGDIMQPTIYGNAGAIKANVSLNKKITFYVRWGDVIARIAIFITGLLLLRSLVVILSTKSS